MQRLNPDCWLWTPGPPPRLLHQHAAVLRSREDEEEEEEQEEEEEHPAVCCYTTGCDCVLIPAADARWLTIDPSSSSGPGAPPSHQQLHTEMPPDDGRNGGGGGGGGCPGRETQGCVCVYGQGEPGCLAPCWSGSPYVYYGVRRNVVVGVEVVEEVAVEDTLEVISEDMGTDVLMDPELRF